jgi:hypothetical protein
MLFHVIHDVVTMIHRQRADRLNQPSAIVLDRQSVKVLAGNIRCIERNHVVDNDEIGDGLACGTIDDRHLGRQLRFVSFGV